MKCAILFATLAAIAVPATAAPLNPNERDWYSYSTWEINGNGDQIRTTGGGSCGRPKPTANWTPTIVQGAIETNAETSTEASTESPAPDQTPGVAPPTKQNNAQSPPAPATGGGGGPVTPFADDQTRFTEDSSAEDVAGTSAQAKLCLDYHNQWRAQFGTPPLEWDSGLAQKAADHMGSCSYSHTGSDNLSWKSSSDGVLPVHSLMDGWANEYSLYNYNNPGYADATGHFTAMTWKAATKIGCGWKLGCNNDNNVFFQCIYSPKTNMAGKYEENVLPYQG